MTQTVKVGILGATGMVGQRFAMLLDNHPWFRVTELVASERSAGKLYKDAATWVVDDPMPASVRDMRVKTPADDLDVDLVFSAIPGGKAGPIETSLAERGIHVFSNARDHRWDADVPLLLPEVNPDHLALVERQKTRGKIVTNGNCSTITALMSLKPLHDVFGLEKVFFATYQAVSGAGYPGVPSLAIMNNVIPHIGGEEEKMEKETRKFLGAVAPEGVKLAEIGVSATCVRVPVQEGHTVAITAQFRSKPTPEEAAEVMATWQGAPQKLKLPSAPLRPLHVRSEPDRPQPRKDVYAEKGMAVSVGRIRPDNVLDLRWIASGSNTIRGAAGSNVLGAELFVAQKRL
ncbi:MAG: aspartate-semialdehyde dehydrogenase [Thermoplasmata archaeon]|jgi:aspartate-semialdehyde dehydrogenase|nr:aspartate-semialdehyde dehydrogenase [Thermoplasmata archaeon]